ncbi:MAG: sensor histidine kinase, partial [Lachnospiraceae bacterium]|nr:sensor histidine kinase [Lachnospiraceae bacterium]
MNLYHDKHIKSFYLFLLLFSLLLFLSDAVLCITYTNTAMTGRGFLFFIIADAFLLSVFLFGGTFLFFKKRECLYQEAADTVKCYIDGDYSRHLPQNKEGTIYYVFHLIEELATILQSKNEAEHRAKEFLKDTISDISHQLKTPLAACSIYQEIMEKEPEKPDVIKEFSYKTGLAIKRMEQLIQSM